MAALTVTGYMEPRERWFSDMAAPSNLAQQLNSRALRAKNCSRKHVAMSDLVLFRAHEHLEQQECKEGANHLKPSLPGVHVAGRLHEQFVTLSKMLTPRVGLRDRMGFHMFAFLFLAFQALCAALR